MLMKRHKTKTPSIISNHPPKYHVLVDPIVLMLDDGLDTWSRWEVFNYKIGHILGSKKLPNRSKRVEYNKTNKTAWRWTSSVSSFCPQQLCTVIVFASTMATLRWFKAFQISTCSFYTCSSPRLKNSSTECFHADMSSILLLLNPNFNKALSHSNRWNQVLPPFV